MAARQLRVAAPLGAGSRAGCAAGLERGAGAQKPRQNVQIASIRATSIVVGKLACTYACRWPLRCQEMACVRFWIEILAIDQLIER